MEEKSPQEEAEPKSVGEAYELDLGGENAEVDDVMRDALAAVEAAASKKRADPHNPDEEPVLEVTLDNDLDSDIEIEEPATEASADAAASAEAAPAAAGSQEAEELRNRLMRTLADFDNFRKRAEKEKEDHKKFAVADVFKDILGVTDNLQRAVDAPGGVDELKKGVEMILRQQSEVFRRWGVEPVKAVGEPFDPAVHEAVARSDSSEITVPTVTGELQRGYTIHDRLLRPAMVSVAMPVASPTPKGDSDAETGDA